MILGLAGKRGSGKSTAAKLIQELTPTINWQEKMFAAKLKDMICTLLGCTREQLEDIDFKEKVNPVTGFSPRYLMQTLGTEWGRNLDYNFWVNALFSEYQPKVNWIITDVRFKNEAEIIRQHGGLVIRINRNTEEQDNHPSETSLDNYAHFNAIIDNNGTLDELHIKLMNVLEYNNLLI